jgi:hypothetical protein
MLDYGIIGYFFHSVKAVKSHSAMTFHSTRRDVRKIAQKMRKIAHPTKYQKK